MRIGLLGFGEAGSILGGDLAAEGAEIFAFDPKFADPASKASRNLTATIRKAAGPADLRDCELIVSAVTAGEAEAAAQAMARHLRPAAWFLDINSVAPESKRRNAAIITDAGGRYVEAAVMSPIPPKRLATPILLGGPEADAFLPVGRGLGFADLSVFSAKLGEASAVKMCRSVIVKGMEALFQESMLAARFYGVEASVLASLADFFPGKDMNARAIYLIGRTLEHGTRRAEEMREAARTVSDAGLDPLMSTACAERQEWSPRFAAALSAADLGAMLDTIRAGMADASREDAAQ